MKALKELEKINNINFKLLVLSPFVYIFGNIGLHLTGFDFIQIYIFNIILVGLQAIMFIKDRKFLKAKSAYCPAWEWFILFPIYVFKRQKNNFLNLNYFYISVVIFVVNIIIAAYIRNIS
ncbi:hypothetical protein M2R48_07445 [Acinetobacter sp. I-MWF]|jgi:hypothetical protein|uniref:hypothetical protein n=1 Tax=Acinetobacter TaxID=469 RepID=UPI0021C6858C|nr:hypothetical protein [Acinetobacter sp. I-MWF]MCT9978156.1 hypothetical protein [Acinetobacter sp. I-MWF]